ncbi:FIST N-terminal domain-containing protein, partial [Chondromyces apiculatus]|uniref:FIST N-terminal domain-containing protein n=1 Tax=Chondromyces apiculatus TaxID=51 RepID=UPI0023DDBC41
MKGHADGMGEIEEIEFNSDTNLRSAAVMAGMRVRRFSYDLEQKRWSEPLDHTLDAERTLVLVFGAPELIDDPSPLGELRRIYPKAHLIGCSSAGEIAGPAVRDHSLSVSVTRFEKTTLATAVVEVSSMAGSHAAGQQLARKLA